MTIPTSFTNREPVELKSFEDAFASMHTAAGTLMTLGHVLQRAAEKFPHKNALLFQDKKITYQELYYRACLLSEVMRHKGIKPADRVLLFVENSIDFYVFYFAIVQSGAVVAALNIFLHEKELAHIVNDAQPVLIATTQVHEELFIKLAPQIPRITEQDIDWSSAVSPVHHTQPDVDPDEMVALLYTSGTTGLPKGVMLSSRNIMINISQAMSRFKVQQEERFFSVLPLFHSFAQNTCIWSAFFMGATVIVVPKIERRHILEGLKHKPTIFLGVPALYGLLCLLKTAPLDSVRYFVCGGDALPNKIRSAFALVYGRNICNGYGLTESSPFIAGDLEDYLQPTNTVGVPLVGIECQLKTEDGAVVPINHKGELWIKGGNVMLGYYRAFEATEKAVKDGWLLTGDVVTFDPYGKIVICGRERDLIAHKGIKIYPAEIENILLSHSAVLRAAVIGQDDEQTGQIPVAFIQLKEGTPQAGLEEQLAVLCKENVAAYKVPRRFFIIDDMPVTATGKIDKKTLRLRLAELK